MTPFVGRFAAKNFRDEREAGCSQVAHVEGGGGPGCGEELHQGGRDGQAIRVRGSNLLLTRGEC